MAQGSPGLMSWENISRAQDLRGRIFFTLIILVIYRLGTFIPLPGIDPTILSEIFNQNRSGLLGLFDLFSGGALSRMTVFALNVIPYISASIIMQLMTSVVPTLEAIKKEGEGGRQQINQYTRYLTVLLTVVQGFGIAVALEGLQGASGGYAVAIPGTLFKLSTIINLVGGTLLLMWLGEQITSRGIGNGISLIIYSGIIASLPGALGATLELGRTGALPAIGIILILVAAVVVIGIVVFVERAHRRILVQYPKRQVGMRITGGESTHLPLKLNMSGVIPPIFATSLLFLPVSVANFNASVASAPDWLSSINAFLGRGQPLYLIIYASLILFFAFVYTAVVFNPRETADNLRKNGGVIPGFRPGENTARYLDFVLTRLTTIGSIYLVAVCLLPEILIARFALPFYFGGTSLLIIVSVTMDTMTQVQGHLYSQHYDRLVRHARIARR